MHRLLTFIPLLVALLASGGGPFLSSSILAQVAVSSAESTAADAEAAASEARLLTGVRQLTFEGRRAGEGYFSKDGTQLVFQSERSADNPFFQIYLMDLETGDTESHITGNGQDHVCLDSPRRP